MESPLRLWSVFVLLMAGGAAACSSTPGDDLTSDSGGATDSGMDENHHPPPPDASTACTPHCAGKHCGADGCGGTCGTCAQNEACNNGACEAACTPSCSGLACGDDGCGGSCGACSIGVCVQGACGCNSSADCPASNVCAFDANGVGACDPSCDVFDPQTNCPPSAVCNSLVMDAQNHVFPFCEAYGTTAEGMACTQNPNLGGSGCVPGTACILDASGTSATCAPFCDAQHPCATAGLVCMQLGEGSTAIPFSACLPSGICTPACAGKQCGDDGCGGSCGSCTGNASCTAANQCVCTPQCAGKSCGDDGCGGSCGTCAAPDQCGATGQCSPPCVPSCSGKACGTDGCGGSCGACAGNAVCDASSQCVCTPNCFGKVCGDDGCGGSCGACSGAGETCGAAGQCCGAVGGSCTFGGACCSGNCDVNTNQCVSCLSNGGTSFCSSDSECCSGICDGRAGVCGTCKESTSSCTSSAQCCSGLSCTSGLCL